MKLFTCCEYHLFISTELNYSAKILVRTGLSVTREDSLDPTAVGEPPSTVYEFRKIQSMHSVFNLDANMCTQPIYEINCMRNRQCKSSL